MNYTVFFVIPFDLILTNIVTSNAQALSLLFQIFLSNFQFIFLFSLSFSSSCFIKYCSGPLTLYPNYTRKKKSYHLMPAWSFIVSMCEGRKWFVVDTNKKHHSFWENYGLRRICVQNFRFTTHICMRQTLKQASTLNRYVQTFYYVEWTYQADTSLTNYCHRSHSAQSNFSCLLSDSYDLRKTFSLNYCWYHWGKMLWKPTFHRYYLPPSVIKYPLT